MDLKTIAKDTAKTLQSYLTYRAMRVVVAQLSETNPPKSVWLQGFSSTGKIQDGEAYLEELMAADPDMAMRLMTVRSHLAAEIADFLPEMVKTGIESANMVHRRQHLERIAQFVLAEEPPLPSQPENTSSSSEPSNSGGEAESDR
jgi:hypothetical protein